MTSTLRPDLVLLCGLLALAAVTPLAARAQPRDAADPAALAAFEAGRDAYDRGRFDEALRQFERAFEISGAPKLLFNIGRAAESDGRNRRAIEAYEAYLRNVPDAENREFVEARLAKLRPAEIAPTAPPTHHVIAVPEPAAAPQPAPAPAPEPVAHDASREPGGVRIYAGLLTAFGGGVDSKVSYDSPTQYDQQTFDFDLHPTVGLQAGAGYAWRYVSLAAEMRVAWFKVKAPDLAASEDVEDVEDAADIETSREKLLDLSLKPAGRYFFSKLGLEIYAALPVGVTFAFLDLPPEFDTKPGVNVGFVAGATYFFTRNLGLNLETGVHWHRVKYSGSGEFVLGEFDSTYTSKDSLTQGVLALNAVAAF